MKKHFSVEAAKRIHKNINMWFKTACLIDKDDTERHKQIVQSCSRDVLEWIDLEIEFKHNTDQALIKGFSLGVCCAVIVGIIHMLTRGI